MVKKVSRVMKDSGDERIAFIPNEWGLIKLKYIVDCNKDVLRETTDHNYSFRYVDIGSVSLEKGIEKYERVSFGDSPSRARRIVHKGDVIVSTVRTYLKAIANIDDADNVIVSTGFAVLSPRIVDPLFLEYACKSHYFTENVTIESTGISYPAINSTKLLQLKIAVPSKEEQVIIGQILHDRIKEIDRVIEQTKLTIEDYKLLKQSIITEAVTKGLDKNVEMKDSGIEWVGTMPAHWYKLRGKVILNKLTRPVIESDAVVTCFRDGEVTLRSNRREDGFTMADKEIGYQGVEPGDLVVHGMDGFAGAIGISDSRGKSSPVLNVLDSKQNKKYIMYYLRSMAYSDVFLALATGIRVRSCDLRWNKIGDLPYPVPPIEEQNEIVEYIDDKLSQINVVIERKQALLEQLESYKKSLIYEYVTGKKEVK